MKVLLAVDDTECAIRAVDHVVAHLRDFGERPELHLIHVQFQLPAAITDALDHETVHRYYEEESVKALEPARNKLQEARIEFKEIHLVGQHPGIAIAQYATKENFSLVVMGSHGQGALSSLVLGSVARHVLAHCSTPALIIR